jgi:dipeptidyl aminopeptidase/acylaminoacyl peptidase
VLASSDRADVDEIWLDPKTAAPQAYTVNYVKPEITVLDASVKKDVEFLTKKLGDGFTVTNRTQDDSVWTVVTDDPRAPAVAYLYDRKAASVTKLFEQRPALARAPLVPQHPREIKARDGLTLVSYLSLPPGSDANVRGVVGQLPRLDGLRQEIRERREPRVGREDAR